MYLDGQTDEKMIFFVMFIVSFASGVKYVLSVRLGNGTRVRLPMYDSLLFLHITEILYGLITAVLTHIDCR